MKIALNGASGLIGEALQGYFEDLVLLGRNETPLSLESKLQGVDVLINLAGAPISKRWSSAYQKVLWESRIETTRALVKALGRSSVRHFISFSAVGIYPQEEECTETCAQRGKDFLARLCSQWEAEALHANIPTAILRMGVVLAPRGGALAQMKRPFSWGLGGVLGDGSQKMSWIHIDDVVRLIDHIIQQKATGIFNATAPHIVTNRYFTQKLCALLGRRPFLALPKWALFALMGKGAQVLLSSTHATPQAALQSGFVFRFASLDAALMDCVAQW
ncbi:MAG: hypothetical protein KU37_11825 [Sulfuricurvum sp. PC08-66]|nr:MAG: hypothetical protein KU37_11825 [Sulfuricurvum sp. PC08-66]